MLEVKMGNLLPFIGVTNEDVCLKKDSGENIRN